MSKHPRASTRPSHTPPHGWILLSHFILAQREAEVKPLAWGMQRCNGNGVKKNCQKETNEASQKHHTRGRRHSPALGFPLAFHIPGWVFTKFLHEEQPTKWPPILFRGNRVPGIQLHDTKFQFTSIASPSLGFYHIQWEFQDPLRWRHRSLGTIFQKRAGVDLVCLKQWGETGEVSLLTLLPTCPYSTACCCRR